VDVEQVKQPSPVSERSAVSAGGHPGTHRGIRGWSRRTRSRRNGGGVVWPL